MLKYLIIRMLQTNYSKKKGSAHGGNMKILDLELFYDDYTRLGSLEIFQKYKPG